MKKVLISIIIVLCIVGNGAVFAYIDIYDDNLKETVSDLSKFNIINGYADGTFKPDNNITRAEFSKIICTAGIYDMVTENTSEFNDVSATHWAVDYIYTAKNIGIINGTSKTTFAPESYITYEQAIKMVVAALGYNDEASQKGGYPTGYITVANELGILDGIQFINTNYATRADIARIVRNALDVPFYFLTNDNGTIHRELSSISLYEIHDITFSTPVEDEMFDEENDIDTGSQLKETETDSVG